MKFIKNPKTGVMWPKILGKDYPDFMVEVEIKNSNTHKGHSEDQLQEYNTMSQQLFQRDIREVPMAEIRALAAEKNITAPATMTKAQVMQKILENEAQSE